jgi:hypothetical protein
MPGRAAGLDGHGGQEPLRLLRPPYMQGRMTKHDRPSYVPDFVVGQVSDRPLRTSRILFYH